VRIGQGFDVHAFEAGGRLVLGGVEIPYSHGLKAHSDGDVLLHALCDALLGAAALGDIGKHFPDNDVAWRNADSRELLRAVYAKVEDKGLSLVNTDMTLVVQAPKLAPYIDRMREHIASDLCVPIDAVSVKATTTEHLGFTGRKEGIAAFAIVLLADSA
jgi:2-C-methyl-D-erythritol 2,4-cyclodiphosphate synthase